METTQKPQSAPVFVKCNQTTNTTELVAVRDKLKTTEANLDNSLVKKEILERRHIHKLIVFSNQRDPLGSHTIPTTKCHPVQYTK